MTHDGPFRAGDSCDEYEIVGLLGKGGFGAVYEAIQPFKISLKDGSSGVGRRVALKCLQLDQAVREDQVERLKKEALLLMHLQHPNIVSVIDAGTAPGGIVYFVMERLYGASLRDVATRERPMAIQRAVYLVGEIGDGLAYASQFGIVHRDLKPENIFVTQADEAKILDFGTARYQAFGAKTTNPLKVPGTPQYMAPEQLEGRPDVDHRADIFALGTIAYELLSGRHPFAKPELTYAEVRDRQLSGAPEPLHQVKPGIPEYLAEVVAIAMARERKKRYQTARAFVLALRDACRRYEAESAATDARSSRSAPPVVISARGSNLDVEATIPDTNAWFLAGGAPFNPTAPERVPTEILDEAIPPMATIPTVLISDAKSTHTANRRGSWRAAALAFLRRHFAARPVAPLPPGVPERGPWIVPSIGFAIVVAFGIWKLSSSSVHDESRAPASAVRIGVPTAVLAVPTSSAEPSQSPHELPSTAEDKGAEQPAAAAIPTTTSAPKKAAPRHSSPKREPGAPERAWKEAPRDAKASRAKAKPATTAPESDFFRTMGDD
jgi:serine/threonine-protein kinase